MKYLGVLIGLVTILIAQPVPSVVVFSFSPVGVDEATAKTATSVFRSELTKTNKFVVIDADVIKNKIGNDDAVDGLASAVEKAKLLGVAKAVIGSVSILGKQTLIEVKLIDVASASIEFYDRLASTTGEDLDIILARLAIGVAEKKTSEATAEVGKIVKKEAEEPLRRTSFLTASIRVGVLAPIYGFGDNPGFPFGNAFSVNYEADKFMGEMSYSFYGYTDNANLSCFEISGFKLMSKTDMCPYFGGGVGIGSVYTSNSGGTGPFINFGGGLIFLRTYDFRFIIDARYRISFISVRDYYTNEGSDIQNSLSLSVGLMYRRKSGTGCCIFF